MILTDKLADHLSGGDRQDEQAVIVCLQFPAGKFQNKKAQAAIFDLNDIFRVVIETSDYGSYNGYEFSKIVEEELVTFYFSCRHANLLYNEIKPILQALPMLSNVSILKRYAKHLLY
ncbi:MAG: hypothetical protein ACR2LN_07885 [Candidatus Levyibacteriota bacterium]